MEQAIRKAIEGGYRSRFVSPAAQMKFSPIDYDSILLDPLFWQALGKAMGWDWDMKAVKCSCSPDIYYSHKFCPKCGKEMMTTEYWTTNWKKNWHRFIDALMQGQSPDDFFKDLIK